MTQPYYARKNVLEKPRRMAGNSQSSDETYLGTLIEDSLGKDTYADANLHIKLKKGIKEASLDWPKQKYTENNSPKF